MPSSPKGLNSFYHANQHTVGTYTQIIYQIVFGTKAREKVLSKENRDELFKYIAGIIENKKCFLYRINGVEDHLHIILSVHPTVALAALVKDIKVASSLYIKQNNLFKKFRGWQDGYGAFTYHISAKKTLIEYVNKQEEHHRKKSMKVEMIEFLKDHQVDYDEKYLQ